MFKDPFRQGKRRRRGLRFMEVDAAIDTGLYTSRQRFARGWTHLSIFMDRFRVRGWRRALNELASDAMTMGVLGGLVTVMLAIPAFKETEKDWRAQTEYSVTFLDRYGEEIGQRGILQNDAIPLEAFPDYFIKAVLATEDRRFYSHFGIDIPGTMRAMLTNARAGGVVQGGSSLTQQLAKNLFLSSEQTLDRKIKEAFLSLWLEANLTKDEILKLYLDRAYMGGGAHGADAAARFYFDKSIRDVTLAEAAMLAGLFKAPSNYAPHRNLPRARARANEVLYNLVQAGFMTEGEIRNARLRPAEPVTRDTEERAQYFIDWAYERVQELVPPGGRTIFVRTTIDTGLQRHAEQVVQATLRQIGQERRVSQSAAVVLETDGAVRAMVGGRDYGESQFNRATQARRQPGSSFKPFVYAQALIEGYEPSSVVVDKPRYYGDWSPRNYGRSYAGSVTLQNALARSINTIPVFLAQSIGQGKIVELAKRMGVDSPITITRSLPLGVAEITVLEMAQSYAVFANGGNEARGYGIISIRDSGGEIIYQRPDTEPTPVLEPRVAMGMNQMLNAVVMSGTGRRAQIEGVTVAGKTGTTQSYRDAWFVGYTGNYAGAVWLGNDDFTQTNNLTGGSTPAQTWQQIMDFAHSGIDLNPMPGVDDPNMVIGQREAPAEAEQQRFDVLNDSAIDVLGDMRRDFERMLAADVATGGPAVADTETASAL